MKDLRGNDIRIGQEIVYGGRYGSTQGYTAVATVKKLNENSITVEVIAHSGHVAPGTVTIVRRPDRVVVTRP